MMHNGISGVTNDNVTPILWATDDPPLSLVWGLHLFINPAYFFYQYYILLYASMNLKKPWIFNWKLQLAKTRFLQEKRNDTSDSLLVIEWTGVSPAVILVFKKRTQGSSRKIDFLTPFLWKIYTVVILTLLSTSPLGASSGVCIKMEQNVYLNTATTTMLRRCREDVFKSKVRGFSFCEEWFPLRMYCRRRCSKNVDEHFNKSVSNSRCTIRGRIWELCRSTLLSSTPSSFVIITAISRSKVTRVIESLSLPS